MKKHLKKALQLIFIIGASLLSSCQFYIGPVCFGTCDSDDSILANDNLFVQRNADNNGMTFTEDDIYYFDNLLNDPIQTLEVSIELPYISADNFGIICSNYVRDLYKINLKILSNGNPAIYYVDSTGQESTLVFDKVTIIIGEKTNLSFVSNIKTNDINCYVNGTFKQSLDHNLIIPKEKSHFRIGSEDCIYNDEYFKGKIFNLSIYSTVRNEEQIKTDTFKTKITESELLAAFELSDSSKGQDIMSLNKTYSLIYDRIWLNEIEEPDNVAYSFSVVGDTQTINYHWPQHFKSIYDYILDNKEINKTSFYIGLGDITDRDSTEERERAKKEISRLNNNIPYIINRGNHDSITKINEYFGINDEYYSSISDYYEYGHIENSYKTFEIYEQKYIIFALDYGAPDYILNWAGDIIESLQDYRIIVTTHAYLFRDGTTLDENDICPPSSIPGLNNGDHIWDKFIKHYDIDLVLSGHDPSSDIIYSQVNNINGYKVNQLLIDPQGIDYGEPTGMVATLYFLKDGKTVEVRYYSTVKKMWRRQRNQFSFKLQ